MTAAVTFIKQLTFLETVRCSLISCISYIEMKWGSGGQEEKCEKKKRKTGNEREIEEAGKRGKETIRVMGWMLRECKTSLDRVREGERDRGDEGKPDYETEMVRSARKNEWLRARDIERNGELVRVRMRKWEWKRERRIKGESERERKTEKVCACVCKGTMFERKKDDISESVKGKKENLSVITREMIDKYRNIK